MKKSRILNTLKSMKIFLLLLLLFTPLISAERGVTVESGVGGIYTIYNYVNETDTANYWDALDTPADITHASLGSLQGGIGGEYYHVQQSWFDEITADLFNWLTASEVYAVADLNYSQIYTDLVSAINGNYTASGNEWSPAMINNISLINTDINSAVAGNKTEIYGEVYGAANLNYSEIYSLITGNYTAGEGTYNSTSWNRTGTNVFLANTGDSVGIGTTTPGEKLTSTGNLYLQSTNPYIFWDSNNLFLASKSNAIPVVSINGSASYDSRFDMYGAGNTEKKVVINTNGDSYFNGGDVGIGTDSPVFALHINATNPYIRLENSSTGAEGNVYFNDATGLTLDTSSYDFPVRIGPIGTTGGIFVDTDGNNGNVGINTTSPGASLDVMGTLHVTEPTGTTTLRLITVAGGSYIGTSTNHPLILRTNGAEIIRIASDGKVGIGTDSAGVTLETNSSSSANNVFRLRSMNGSAMYFTGNSSATTIMAIGEPSAIVGGALTDDASIYMTSPSTNLRFYAGSGELMRLTGAGSLGIGITSPLMKLNVAGTGGLPTTTGTTQNGSVRVEGVTNAVMDFGSDSASPYGQWIQATDKTDLSIEYPLLLNPNGGNVGIGTTSPGATLDVNGNVTIGADTASSGALDVKNTGSGYTVHFKDSGGNSRFVLENDGNIGIGTTSPVTKFDVAGNGQWTGAIRTTYNSTNYGNILAQSDGIMYFRSGGTGGAGYAFTDSDANPTVRITNSGSVGIGTTAPTAPLSILKDATGGSPYIGQILISPSSDSESAGISFNTTATGTDRIWTILAGTGSTNANFRIYDSSAALTRLSIDTNGNVGIGTTTPSEMLDVAGDIALSADIQQTGTTAQLDINPYRQLRLGRMTNNTDFGVQVFIGDGTVATNHLLKGIGNSYVNANNGNFGVGTTSPSVPLQVNGSVGNITIMAESQIAATGFIVFSPSLSSYSGNLLSTIPKPLEMLGADGKLDRLKMFSNEKQTITLDVPDYSKPISNIGYNEECESVYLRDNCANVQTGETCEIIEEIESCTPIYEEQCTPVYENQCTQIPYEYITYNTIQQTREATEVSSMAFNNRLMIAELKEENTKFKNCLAISADFNSYKTCVGGI